MALVRFVATGPATAAGEVDSREWPVFVAEADWLGEVNRPHAEAELAPVRRSVQRSQPYGDDGWATRVAQRLGLESTLRARGRPRKEQRTDKES